MSMTKGSRETTVLGAFFNQTRKLRQTARADGVFIVLDDDPDVRDFVQSVIKKEGRRVRSAQSMVSAKELIDELGPDNVACIVVDAMLPDGSGTVFGDWLLRTHPRIPFFYLSGRLEEHELAFGGHRVQVLHKPASVDELLEALGMAHPAEPALA